jgi:hypothetical protein
LAGFNYPRRLSTTRTKNATTNSAMSNKTNRVIVIGPPVQSIHAEDVVNAIRERDPEQVASPSVYR